MKINREKHMEGFLNWGNKLNIDFIYNKID